MSILVTVTPGSGQLATHSLSGIVETEEQELCA